MRFVLAILLFAALSVAFSSDHGNKLEKRRKAKYGPNFCATADDDCWQKVLERAIDDLTEKAEDEARDARRGMKDILSDASNFCETQKGNCERWVTCRMVEEVTDEFPNFLTTTETRCAPRRLDKYDDAVREPENDGAKDEGDDAADDALDYLSDANRKMREECKLYVDLSPTQQSECRKLMTCILLRETTEKRFEDFVSLIGGQFEADGISLQPDVCPDDLTITPCTGQCRVDFLAKREAQTLNDVLEEAKEEGRSLKDNFEEYADDAECRDVNDLNEDDLDKRGKTKLDCERAMECVFLQKVARKFDDYMEKDQCGKSERKDAKKKAFRDPYDKARSRRRDILNDVRDAFEVLEGQCEVFQLDGEPNEERIQLCKDLAICEIIEYSLEAQFPAKVKLTDRCEEAREKSFAASTTSSAASSSAAATSSSTVSTTST